MVIQKKEIDSQARPFRLGTNFLHPHSIPLPSKTPALGLPQRYHARAAIQASDPLSLVDDDGDNKGASAAAGAAGAAFEWDDDGDEEEEEEEEDEVSACVERGEYMMYLVSDWRNVTSAHVQRLQKPDAGACGHRSGGGEVLVYIYLPTYLPTDLTDC
jgi:hypothetical protein